MEIGEVDAGSSDAQQAMSAYFAELAARFPAGFDPTGYLDAADYNPPAGRFFLVREDDAVAACGGLVWVDETTAEIKRMWVDPAFRGQGIARVLLGFLEEAAAASGRTRVILDTNPVLLEAIAMYRRSGYQDIPRYNDNPYAGLWFEKLL